MTLAPALFLLLYTLASHHILSFNRDVGRLEGGTSMLLSCAWIIPTTYLYIRHQT